MKSEAYRHGLTRTFKVSRRVLEAVLTLLSLFFIGASAPAQAQIAPGKDIETIGVPPIPTSLAREVSPYSNIYGLPLAGWDPQRREIWLKGLSSVA